MTTPVRHREISEEFMAHADEEFEKGDILQASEKAWGGVVHYLKAVAEVNGWPHQSHYDVRKNAHRLIQLTDDPDHYTRAFIVVEQLHVNYYEEKHPAHIVRLGIDDAKALLAAFRSVEPQP